MALEADRYVRRRNVSWAGYLAAMAKRGEGSVPRITYLLGELQLMTPSFDHEAIGRLIGFLVADYCVERDIPVRDVGSWTIKDRLVERGAEPDACFVFGTRRKQPARPDVVVEVIWTSGGLDKLEAYAMLRVREVWVWKNGQIEVYRLHGDRYRKLRPSRFLPELDLDLLARFLDRPTYNQAVRDFRAALARE